MNLSDLLSERRVLVPLQAKTLAEGVQALAEACEADGRVTDRERLVTAIREAWPEDTVTMGPDAFLPHFRTDAVPAVVAALGVTAAPVRLEPKSQRKARIILLIIAPPGESAAYLQTVGAFARALSQPDIVTGLLEAKGAADVLANPGLRAVRFQGPLLVKDLMTSSIPTVTPETLLGEAAKVLLASGLETIPVVGEQREVIGLLSTLELLNYLVPAFMQRRNLGEMATRKRGSKARTDPALLPVREVMSRNVLCLPEDQSIGEAAAIMASKRLEGVPVVEDGILRGYLTRSAIVREVIE